MKGAKFLPLVLASIILLTIMAVILDWVLPNARIFRSDAIVFLLILSVSLPLMIRGWILKIDSSLFAGLVLLGVSSVGLTSVYFGIGYAILWPYMVLGVGIAHYVVSASFYDRLQAYLGTVVMGEFVICLLYSLGVISLFWMIAVTILWVLAVVMGYNYFKIKRGTR